MAKQKDHIKPLKVEVVNKPSKAQAKEQINHLSEYLSRAWKVKRNIDQKQG